jgi:biopolymer transport protein ExbB
MRRKAAFFTQVRWAIAAAAIVLPTMLTTAANAEWWQTDWSFRKQITIDTTPKGANISESLGRVPVLIRLHSGNFVFSDAQDNGADIRFVASYDKTPLTYHIESFDPLLGIATIWIDVPEFPAGGTKDIWLYYGNKKAPAALDTAGTFDANYTLVYHFDDAAGTPPHDKTAYGNNAQTAPSGTDDGAVIGRGARFLGTAAMTIPATPSLAIAASGEQTISMWVKSAAPQPQTALYVRRSGSDALLVGLDQDIPFVEIDKGGAPQRFTAPQAIAAGQWTHLAVISNASGTALYVGGRSVAQSAAALPALNTPIQIGGEAAGVAGLKNFTGELDELRFSRIARPAGLMLADALGQGGSPKLIVFGVDEKQSGFSFGYFGIIVSHVTIDAWVVISILGLMALMSWMVMWTKASYVGTVSRANEAFMAIYRRHGGNPAELSADSPDIRARARLMSRSSIYRIFRAGADEIGRRAQGNARPELDGAAIEVIRAIMDSSLVRENQRLASSMVLLTISISGGPFLGLLGTVVGVMITFAAIAAAGDVNINAIAPGISAALLATVAGLAVAIPALFGYNYLIVRNKNVTANMLVFVDEFVTRSSEFYRVQNPSRHAL